jgi:adenine-specific DNA-methyltransferase
VSGLAENAVYEMDALELLRGLDDGSVDAVITDPPYNGVKADAWDNQWASDDDFIAWMGQLCEQWKRVLKPNGSLYVFASPRMAARVEVEIGRWFNVLNRITWLKGEGWHQKAAPSNLRGFFPATEAIVFAEQFAADGRYASQEYEINGRVFAPLKQWFRDRADAHGIGLKQLNTALGSATNGGGLASGFFGDKAEFQPPTRDRYAQMQAAFPGVFDRDYIDIRREYETLRREYETLRRPFSLSIFTPYTDVWTFRTVQHRDGKHPCEKPLVLLEHMIAASTRPGDVVLDTFAGSGATLDAARRLGRRYIGNDFDPHWAEYARRRLSHGYTLPMLGLFAEEGAS